ncbi:MULTISPECIES: ferredoxin [unclassified Mucilaginibacter]|uniref:ferredoxin n=1 Tax=unclassified Mucilaginibacter TaxID=2617802 RepID=UPI002AC92B18|nr:MULTISPECIES: ferredoxin [unclassified Mucilaginibacter]MEB0260068.1 ferredoxin [Mucilaginibacter sp. 10I4]MEB0280572.1 ferredoxin [Mucilaginibacter sp. 10B2]MEB0301088.1 ferredoxin [Mucilaginibacter sp. 5C4]WPX22395.1 ferredoxin [Mucilaginibacter sp. 5C4]
MMGKYKISLDRETCICTHNCAAEAPGFWIEAEDGKIDLIRAVYNKKTNIWELKAVELNEKDLKVNLLAEAGCPVDAIEIVKVEV